MLFKNRRLPIVKESLHTVLFCLIFLLAGADIDGLTADAMQKIDYEQYCTMLNIWEDDKNKGIPEAIRSGWPPFRGYCIK